MAAVLAAFRLRQQANRQRPLRRERVFRDRTHPLDSYNDIELFRKYRFDRNGCIYLIDLLTDDLRHQSQRNQALSPSLQVFIALNFYATGAVLDSMATIHGVTRSTASHVIQQMKQALCRVKNEVREL